jgi:hypothetical protein
MFGIWNLDLEMTKVSQQAGVRLKNTYQPQRAGEA